MGCVFDAALGKIQSKWAKQKEKEEKSGCNQHQSNQHPTQAHHPKNAFAT